ncbi:unnamed protein product [Staurois parvus]|uniref:Uncharacterized protein n=1 Tax=Staurois parvus TaxID=386267 RepID=A0ABN9FSR0_9NEOB|nr:unnamed protein product [Staurois parvus]
MSLAKYGHVVTLAYCIAMLYYLKGYDQGRTDHLETRALPEGPGSVGAP